MMEMAAPLFMATWVAMMVAMMFPTAAVRARSVADGNVMQTEC